MRWDLPKIDSYLANEVEESLHLDYKAADALGKANGKKKEISKDVSSFANSDGGTIIYGIKEFDDSQFRHLPEKIDPISRSSYSKEWLEQVINSNISPVISDIIITAIEVNRSNTDEVIYVVDIPKSNTAHQAKDKKYYKRYNFLSEPMEDYQIKDIINRSQKAILKIIFQPIKDTSIGVKGMSKKFDIVIRNEGNIMANYLEVYISGDQKTSSLIIDKDIEPGKEFQKRYANEIKHNIEINGEKFILNTERIPVLPNTSHFIGQIEIDFMKDADDHFLEILVSTENSNKHQIVKIDKLLNEK